MNNKPRLGWIGTGVMGHSMAGHLLAAGYPLTVYSRTKAKAEGLLACGARWAETPREVARNADIVFSIVGYPRDVEEVMLGEQGALSGLSEGGILCDMTTSSPELAQRIAAAAAAKGCTSLDAPVTGGDIGAREARLSIFVGGDKEAFERVRPCFEAMGKNILHCRHGPAGETGQPGGYRRRHVQRLRVHAFCPRSRSGCAPMAGTGRARRRGQHGHGHPGTPPAGL